MITGFANGCFDGLHDGHRHFLRECMLNCDRLIVALNSDLSIERRKGKPRIGLGWRRRAVFDIVRCGDEVRSFDTEGELANLIRDNNVTVLFKGEDYVGKAVTGADFAERIHWIARHPGYSTTLLQGKERP